MSPHKYDDYTNDELIDRIIKLTEEILVLDHQRTDYRIELIRRGHRTDQFEKQIKEMEAEIDRLTGARPDNG